MHCWYSVKLRWHILHGHENRSRENPGLELGSSEEKPDPRSCRKEVNLPKGHSESEMEIHNREDIYAIHSLAYVDD